MKRRFGDDRRTEIETVTGEVPVRRNMIVTDDVIEAPTSLVIPEAANREISATVVLKRMLQSL